MSKNIKKPFTYRTDTQQVIKNMQRDFLLDVDKQEMVSVGELAHAKAKDYMKRLLSFLDKCTAHYKEDFFIEVRRWHEVTDRTVTRYKLRQLKALPSPAPGKAYYFYDSKKSELDILWDLPDDGACKFAMRNRFKVGVEMGTAMKTILEYYDGTLHRKADELNEQVNKDRVVYERRK